MSEGNGKPWQHNELEFYSLVAVGTYIVAVAAGAAAAVVEPTPSPVGHLAAVGRVDSLVAVPLDGDMKDGGILIS